MAEVKKLTPEEAGKLTPEDVSALVNGLIDQNAEAEARAQEERLNILNKLLKGKNGEENAAPEEEENAEAFNLEKCEAFTNLKNKLKVR